MTTEKNVQEVRAERLLGLSRAEQWAGELEKHVEAFELLMRERIGPKELSFCMGIVRTRRNAQAWYAVGEDTTDRTAESNPFSGPADTWEYETARAQADAMWSQADAIHRNAEKVARLADRVCEALTAAYPHEVGESK